MENNRRIRAILFRSYLFGCLQPAHNRRGQFFQWIHDKSGCWSPDAALGSEAEPPRTGAIAIALAALNGFSSQGKALSCLMGSFATTSWELPPNGPSCVHETIQQLSRPGLTLTEFLVVMAKFGILAALMLPPLHRPKIKAGSSAQSQQKVRDRNRESVQIDARCGFHSGV